MNARFGNDPFLAGFINGNDAATFGRFAKHAQHTIGRFADAPNNAGLVLVLFACDRLDLAQNAITIAQRRIRRG